MDGVAFLVLGMLSAIVFILPPHEGIPQFRAGLGNICICCLIGYVNLRKFDKF